MSVSVSVVVRVGLGLLLRRRVALVEVLRIRLGRLISRAARHAVPSSLVHLLLLLLRLLSFQRGIRLDSWNELVSDEDESSSVEGRKGERGELRGSGEGSFDLEEGEDKENKAMSAKFFV